MADPAVRNPSTHLPGSEPALGAWRSVAAATVARASDEVGAAPAALAEQRPPGQTLEGEAGIRVIRSCGRIRQLAFAVFATAALPCAMRAADPMRQLLGDLLAPDRISQVTLSPDGRRLAYVVREGSRESLVIRDIDSPGNPVVRPGEAVQSAGGRREGSLVRFPFVGWAGQDALVYLVQLPPKDRGSNEELRVFEVQANQDRKLMDSRAAEGTYQPPPPRVVERGREGPEMFTNMDISVPLAAVPVRRNMRVLGIDPAAPSVIVEATGNSQVETEISRVDVTTGKRDPVDHYEGRARCLSDRRGLVCVRETARGLTPVVVPLSSGEVPFLPDGLTLQRQRFEVRTGGGGRWRSLDALVGGEAKLQFSHDDSDFYAHRSIPLAVDGEGSVVYFASNVGRDTFGVYALEMATGKRTPLTVEHPAFDLVDPADAMSGRALVFDRERRLQGVRMPGWPARTTWFDPVLAAIQAKADARFENRSVRLLEWSDDRTRALLFVGGPMEPGRYFILTNGPTPQFTEVLRRLPALDSDRMARSEPFSFRTPAGVRLTGSVFVPRRARVNPPPLVVVCRDIPGRAADLAAFDRGSQALAAQGFMVLQVNYRGTAGLGSQHRDAVRAGFDRVPLEDVHVALAWLKTQHPYDQRRMALLGAGFGGLIALRGLELFPTEFRCAVVIDAPADPVAWALDSCEPARAATTYATITPAPPPLESAALRRAFFAADFRQARELGAISPLRHIESVQRPVLIIDGRPRMSTPAPQGGKLRAALKSAGREAEYFQSPEVLAGGRRLGGARTIARIGDFLNEHLYDYGVRIGPERRVEDVPPASAAPADDSS